MNKKALGIPVYPVTPDFNRPPPPHTQSPYLGVKPLRRPPASEMDGDFLLGL